MIVAVEVVLEVDVAINMDEGTNVKSSQWAMPCLLSQHSWGREGCVIDCEVPVEDQISAELWEVASFR